MAAMKAKHDSECKHDKLVITAYHGSEFDNGNKATDLCKECSSVRSWTSAHEYKALRQILAYAVNTDFVGEEDDISERTRIIRRRAVALVRDIIEREW